MKPQTLAVVIGALFALGVIHLGTSNLQNTNHHPNVQSPRPTELLGKKSHHKDTTRSIPPPNKIVQEEPDSAEIISNDSRSLFNDKGGSLDISRGMK